MDLAIATLRADGVNGRSHSDEFEVKCFAYVNFGFTNLKGDVQRTDAQLSHQVTERSQYLPTGEFLDYTPHEKAT